MTCEHEAPDGQAATGDTAADPDPDGGLDAAWILPALLILAAKGVRAGGEGAPWDGLAVGLAACAALATVVVFVKAVRRRAYETMTTVAVATLIVGAVAYARGDIP
ncbi:hypothetical protein ACFQY7_30815 [Actinomadura luteofluorescens]|uniref:Uncharacterized protein n=1 Tax=Actinomadura luteofluorescens TaxID=46163 RepID=A0A7Y9JID9_9ACTN|nr:hypothetical protein [Actinomadura luteofluorescens]NYD49731.1 hypothetical protein [Actinomadura luteofluorescens]